MAESIEKRGKNSYRLVCTRGYDLNGKLIKHTKTIHGSKKDAQVELATSTTKISLKSFSDFTKVIRLFTIKK